MVRVWLLVMAVYAGIGLMISLAQADGMDDRLAGTAWQFEMDGKAVLEFGEEGRVSGNAGCNRFSGRYEIVSDDMIRFGPLASTKMLCADEQMTTERKVFDVLQGERDFRLNETRLILKSPTDGKVVLISRSG